MIKRQRIKILVSVFILIIVLAIGYATISDINLNITGASTGSSKQENFKVRFLKAVDNNGPTIISIPSASNNSVNIVNDTTATFTVNSLVHKDESATATYKIKNESNGIDAKLNLTIENTNTEYYEVTKTIDKDVLESNEIATLNVTVKLLKTVLEEDISSTITIKIRSIPKELYDNPKYFVGSSNSEENEKYSDYEDLDSYVFLREQGDSLAVCIIKNSDLSCFDSNNFAAEATHASQVFNYSTINGSGSNWNGISLDNDIIYYDNNLFDQIQCVMYKNGSVACGNREDICSFTKTNNNFSGTCEKNEADNSRFCGIYSSGEYECNIGKIHTGGNK